MNNIRTYINAQKKRYVLLNFLISAYFIHSMLSTRNDSTFNLVIFYIFVFCIIEEILTLIISKREW